MYLDDNRLSYALKNNLKHFSKVINIQAVFRVGKYTGSITYKYTNKKINFVLILSSIY